MKNNLLFFILCIIIFLTFSVLLVNKSQDKKHSSNLRKVSVRLKWLDQAQFSGHYVADSMGYYKENGLDVKVNPGGPNISPIQMVVTGTDDFGITSGNQIILAREQGVPVVAIAVIFQKSPISIVSLKDKNIESPKDLVNKRVGIVYSDDDEIIFKALLRKEELKDSNVFTEARIFDLSQLRAGKIDAEVVYENNEVYLLNKEGYSTNLIRPRDYGINFYGDTIFTTEKMIKENPELVDKFIDATIKGWDYAIKNVDYAIEQTLMKDPSLDRNHQLYFLNSSIPLIETEKIGISSGTIWNSMLQILMEQGLVKKSDSIDSIYSNIFVDK